MTTTTDMTESPKESPAKRRQRSQPRWQRQLRYFYWRFLRLQGTPEQLSRGIASGVFSGCYPLFGFQTIIGIGVATVLRGNRIMAAAATWISNPFTYVPIFAFNFQVGHWMLGGGPVTVFYDLDTLRGWRDMGTDVTVRLMLGSTVVGIAAGIISYFLGVWLIRRIRQRKSDKSNLLKP